MKQIKNLFGIFLRRTRFENTDEGVIFESFRNESFKDFPCTNESNEPNDLSKLSKTQEYVRYFTYNTKLSVWTRHNLSAIFLLFLMMMILMVLPILYLPRLIGLIHFSTANVLLTNFDSSIRHYSVEYSITECLEEIHRKVKTLPPPPKPDYDQCKVLSNLDKYDCYPEDGSNQDNCEARGCCWMPIPSVQKSNSKNSANVPLDVPYCFYPSNFPTYTYLNVSETAFGLVAFMKRNYRSPYPEDVETVKMMVKFETEHRLHVKFTDPCSSRFEPPFPEIPIIDNASHNLSYAFVIHPEQVGFKVIRKPDNVTIFDTVNLRNMIFSDQFLQITAKLPSTYMYGLGEHRNRLLLSTQWQRLTLFNGDEPPQENTNLYGSHPFYLVMEEDGRSHGVFLLNSNAIEVILQPKPAITFRPIGGILDFYFFLGPTPSDVVSQYTDLIGRPFLPPYWSLGFHLCRFGYKTLNETRKIMEQNIAAGILIDTQWNDLDYMNNSNDFTYDQTNFKGLPNFVDELHKRGMHYIPLVDPGISASEKRGSYPPYDTGIEMDIFVKNSTGQPFIGKVWNSVSTVWPDFTNPHTVEYWTTMLKSMHDLFEFDGAWIDMNEPANFLSGSFTGCPNSKLESPPYLPAVRGGELKAKTFCMTAKHYAGVHYNVHNLYGLSEAIATNFALAEIRGKRPFIISRSTFAGQGYYSGHWSGDIYSEWQDMRYSIPQLLSFSLFGIPLMGADICGFNGNTTEPLCNRWSQLGAFYPFARNHNTDDGIDQDPVSMGEEVVKSARNALNVRYTLLPYLYTLFWSANVYGTTVSRPMFIEFPQDKNTYDIDTAFLWGSGILIVPVLDEGATCVMIYLPKGIWYDYFTKTSIKSNGESFTFPADLNTIPILVHGGNVIPQQEPNMTTTQSRMSKIHLLCAPNENGSATGNLYFDDGDSLNTIEENYYSLLQFDLKPKLLTSSPIFWGYKQVPHLGIITVLDVEFHVTQVWIDGVPKKFEYDTVFKVLTIDELDENFEQNIVVTWE